MRNVFDEKRSQDTILKYITFSLGEEDYGIPVTQVLEIVKIDNLITVPHSRDYFKGLMDIRGSVVAVIDLKKKLGMYEDEDGDPQENSSTKRAIIIKAFGKRIGLGVDRVSHVHNFPESTIDTGPSSIKNNNNNYITGVGKIKDDFIILLDLEHLFDSDEISNISTFANSEV